MTPIAMLSGPDLAIVAVVVLVLFGGAKVGGFMRSLGEGVKEFKKATTDDESPVQATTAPPAQAVTAETASKTEDK